MLRELNKKRYEEKGAACAVGRQPRVVIHTRTRYGKGTYSRAGALHRAAQCAGTVVSNVCSHCLSSPWRVAAGYCTSSSNNTRVYSRRESASAYVYPRPRGAESAFSRAHCAARATETTAVNRRVGCIATAGPLNSPLCRMQITVTKEDDPPRWNTWARHANSRRGRNYSSYNGG